LGLPIATLGQVHGADIEKMTDLGGWMPIASRGGHRELIQLQQAVQAAAAVDDLVQGALNLPSEPVEPIPCGATGRGCEVVPLSLTPAQGVGLSRETHRGLIADLGKVVHRR
jgi:hypothetical protein